MASSTSTTEQLVSQFLALLYSLGLQENPDERTIMVMESGLRTLRETRARTFARMSSSFLPQQALGAIEPPLVEPPPVPFLDKARADQVSVSLEPALALGFGLGLGFGWPSPADSRLGSGFGGPAGGGASASGAIAMAPAATTARLQQCVLVLEPAGELQPRVQELLGLRLAHAIVHRAGAGTGGATSSGLGAQQLSPGSAQSFDEHESGNGNGNGNRGSGGSQLAASGEELHASLTLTRSTHSSTGPADNPQATAVNPEWRFLFGKRNFGYTETVEEWI